MKTLLQTVALAAMLAFTTVASAADPVVGNCQLNLAKSKFSPGPAPKTDTRTYTESADGITMTWKSVAANGKEINAKSTFKTDGKDYPMTLAVIFHFDISSVRFNFRDYTRSRFAPSRCLLLFRDSDSKL